METISKESILNKLSEISRNTGLILGTNDKDSDIDIVVDTKELDIPTIEKLKNAFIPMKADVLITDLLKQEDTALDDLLISIGVGKNLDSVYKSIMREVIWVGEKS